MAACGVFANCYVVVQLIAIIRTNPLINPAFYLLAMCLSDIVCVLLLLWCSFACFCLRIFTYIAVTHSLARRSSPPKCLMYLSLATASVPCTSYTRLRHAGDFRLSRGKGKAVSLAVLGCGW